MNSGGLGRRHTNRKTVYPLLDRIAKIAPDEWWNLYILDCAKGMLPSGVTLNGTVISYTTMGMPVHYELSDDLSQAYKELKAFFALHLKVAPASEALKTSTDEQTRRSSADASSRRTTKSTTRRTTEGWVGIRSKNVRSALLSRFVETVTKDYNLDRDQCKNLRNVIYLADLYELLDDTVKLEEGSIMGISCVEFDGIKFHLKKTERKPRVIRIPPPPNPAYKGYPSKQMDPALLIEAHLKALKKQNASGIINKASGIVPNETEEATLCDTSAAG